jgi:hypothetical protein
MGKQIGKVNTHPENIYNMDGKGLILGQALKVKVICCRVQRDSCYRQDGYQKIVIVIGCISAAGKVIPPSYIYKDIKYILVWYAGVQAKAQNTVTWLSMSWTENELGL